MLIRFALLFTVLATALQAAPPEPPKGFRPLFNGQDLAGWHGLNPHSVVKLTGEKKDEALKKMREEFPSTACGEWRTGEQRHGPVRHHG